MTLATLLEVDEGLEPGSESLLIWAVARIFPVSCQGWVAKLEGTTLARQSEQVDSEQGQRRHAAPRRNTRTRKTTPALQCGGCRRGRVSVA